MFQNPIQMKSSRYMDSFSCLDLDKIKVDLNFVRMDNLINFNSWCYLIDWVILWGYILKRIWLDFSRCPSSHLIMSSIHCRSTIFMIWHFILIGSVHSIAQSQKRIKQSINMARYSFCCHQLPLSVSFQKVNKLRYWNNQFASQLYFLWIVFFIILPSVQRSPEVWTTCTSLLS